jgi:hypothetical protein
MKKSKPDIVIYYYKTNAEEAGVADITADGKHIDRLLNTDLGTVSLHNEYALEDLHELENEKRVNISLQEVDEDYSEADFAYAMGDHGCESFDEYVERCNFPEEYE